jgi:hypothetical protein
VSSGNDVVTYEVQMMYEKFMSEISSEEEEEEKDDGGKSELQQHFC